MDDSDAHRSSRASRDERGRREGDGGETVYSRRGRDDTERIDYPREADSRYRAFRERDRRDDSRDGGRQRYRHDVDDRERRGEDRFRSDRGGEERRDEFGRALDSRRRDYRADDNPSMRGRDIRADIANRWQNGGTAGAVDVDRPAIRDVRDEPRSIRQNPSRLGPGSFMEARLEQRQSLPMPWVWSVSPPRSPERDEKHRSKHEKRSRRRHSSDASDSDASDEEDRRRRRHKKHRSSRRERSRHKSRKDRKRSRTPSASNSALSESEAESEGIAAPSAPMAAAAAAEEEVEGAPRAPAAIAAAAAIEEHDSDSDSFGPKPSTTTTNEGPRLLSHDVSFGKHLRPGEGEAMARFVEQNQRIPRRGEVGWKSDEIERLESIGYVMSGSRHKRMNEVRIRKENQILSAAEQKLLEQHNFEEKAAREERIMAEFRRMVAERTAGAPPPS